MNSQASRRVNEQLEVYWAELRGERDFPSEAEIDPDKVNDIWDHCFMVRFEGDLDAPEFRYMYLGQALIEAYGDEQNEKEVCEKLAYPNNNNEHVAKFLEVIRTRKPVSVDSEFTNSKGMIIKYRSCLMPLSKDDPKEVGYILGGMRWKAL